MLHDFAPFLAFMASNKENTELNKDLTLYLYRKQHENIDFKPQLDINMDK